MRTTTSAMGTTDVAQIERRDGGGVDTKHRGAALFCERRGSCVHLQAIEVIVVMATMPRTIRITIVRVLVLG